VKSVDDVAN